MTYDVDVEFGKTTVTVRCKVYGEMPDQWHEEGIYCDGDLTDLLQEMSKGRDWAGYDRLMDLVEYQLMLARRAS